MITCRQEALRWVHRYAIGGLALAAVPIPVSTSSSLAALETYMMKVIGDIYSDSPTGTMVAAAGGSFALGGMALKQMVIQATYAVPGFGIPIRMVIAGGTIEALGWAIVNHYERKHPRKVWSAAAG
jgi:uncharacterized protein (DUF697 family)